MVREGGLGGRVVREGGMEGWQGEREGWERRVRRRVRERVVRDSCE